ncbi:hypothetical protein [Congzhengia sp.]|uniref:hypothetical protein n=1 Tax=Congzhengia sp. TaxID=2944168 RepID=UPI0030780C62
MKKIVFLSITLLLAVGLFSACGCAKKDNNSQSSAAPSQSAAASTSPESSPSASAAPDNNNNAAPGDSVQENDLPAVSENKEVVKEENAPKIFMIQDAESNVDKLTYHLENCKLLEGKETNEVSWEYIKMVGFWQCPECNPPRYEDYANAQ